MDSSAQSSHVYRHAQRDPSLRSDLKQKAAGMAVCGAALTFFAGGIFIAIEARAWQIVSFCAAGLIVALAKTLSLYKSF
jgi:hypothetical protein